MVKNNKRALGRGLSALLENAETDITSHEVGNKTLGSIALIPIDQIEANPFQPRSHFEKEALIELAESIKEHGIIQPVTVRKLGHDKFQLISGERRFRASQAAGLKEIPAYIRLANDQAMLEMALVENIQRQNLDAIEVAISYNRLIEECNLTQEALSQKVSKKRSTVTNYLRLLKLPPQIQLAIRNAELSMGHARTLISIDDEALQIQIFKKLLNDDLSVRQTEDLVRNLSQNAPKKQVNKKNLLSHQHQYIKEVLSQTLHAKVDLKRELSGKGKIVISFDSDEQLDNIVNYFK
jgi:ParB family transcriptional regulator, chromosome partitioning protein